MNPNAIEDRDHAAASDGAKAREDVLYSTDGELPDRLLFWTPDDIAGPEPWALASFSDLLPHELT